MLSASRLIYYISERNIDQLYRTRYGQTEDVKTVEVLNQRDTSLSGKLGLDRLLAVLTGGNLSIEGGVQDKRATSNKTQSTFAVEDRAIRLLREFFADASVDISTVTESKPLSAFYTFHCPVKVSYAAVGPTGGSPDGDPMIEVSHKSSQIEFAGVTSRNNWVSPSLANNLLWESSDGNSSVSMAGIMTPLSLRRDDSRLKMKVQYLVLLHPTEIGLSM